MKRAVVKALRRKVEVGYARGGATRARILDAALRLFGLRGYDGVSTREIATAASVPPPSLQYYFENKPGLYVACIDHAQTIALKSIGPLLHEIEQLTLREASDEELIDAYCAMLDGLIELAKEGPDQAILTLFAFRLEFPSEARVGHPSGMDTLGPRIAHCCASIIRRIDGGRTSEETALMVAMTINSQLSTVIVRPDLFEDDADWGASLDRTRRYQEQIRSNTRSLLIARQASVR